ncbi:hypothetical protein D3C81_2265670 [compost metagenome]
MLVMALCGQWALSYATAMDIPLVWTVLGSVGFALAVYFTTLSIIRFRSPKDLPLISRWVR